MTSAKTCLALLLHVKSSLGSDEDLSPTWSSIA